MTVTRHLYETGELKEISVGLQIKKKKFAFIGEQKPGHDSPVKGQTRFESDSRPPAVLNAVQL